MILLTTAAPLLAMRRLAATSRIGSIIRTSEKARPLSAASSSSSSPLGFAGPSVLASSPAAATAAGGDPSRYVAGVTREQVETDPSVAAFFAANFPDWDKEEDTEEEDAEEDTEEEDDAVVEKTTGGEADDGRRRPVERRLHTKSSRDPRLVVPPHLSALNVRPLYAYRRCLETEEGSRYCDALREERRLIPGVLFGFARTADVNSRRIGLMTPWNILQRELDLYHNHFESRVYELTILEREEDGPPDEEDGSLAEGETFRVVPTGVQLHPILHKAYCVNYLRYHPGRVVKIPIRYINEEESPVMKRGGFIAPVSRYVPCVVEDGAPIPDYIDLECTGLRLREVVRTERMIFPEGVTMDKKVNRKKFLVGTVFGKRALVVGDGDSEEGGGGDEM